MNTNLIFCVSPDITINMSLRYLLGSTLASSNTVRNLQLIFDQNMPFNVHIKQMYMTSFLHLHNIWKK